MQRFRTVFVVVGLMGMVCLADFEVVFPEPRFTIEEAHLSQPGFRASHFDITADLLFLLDQEGAGCDGFDRSVVAGKIVVIDNRWCSLAVKLQSCVDAGCLAVIHSSGCDWQPGASVLPRDGTDPKDLAPVPFLEVAFCDSEPFQAISLETNITVHIDSRGVNPWLVVLSHSAWIPLYFTLAFWTFGVACAALYKVFELYRADQLQPMPAYILLMEVCIGVERLVTYIDPLGHRGIIPAELASAMVGLSVPFSLSSSMVIALAWTDSLRASKQLRNKRSWWLTAVNVAVIVILLCVEICLIVLRALHAPLVFVSALPSVLYLCVNLIVGGWFIVNGYKVLRKLSTPIGSSTTSEAWRKRIRYMTFRVGLAGFGMLMTAAVVVFFATPLFGKAWGFYLIIFFFSCCLEVVSTAQVFAFASVEHRTSTKPSNEQEILRQTDIIQTNIFKA